MTDTLHAMMLAKRAYFGHCYPVDLSTLHGSASFWTPILKSWRAYIFVIHLPLFVAPQARLEEQK